MYLSGVLRDPYNHYCINCKKHKSTHVVIFIGAYVCEKCAKALVEVQGGNKNCYVKSVYGEMWDDYQLKSLAHGGNKNLFVILKEYDLMKQSLIKNYSHPAL